MDKITNYEEFLNLFKLEENIDIVNSNLAEIIKTIKSGNISGTPYNKKYLQNILEFLLKYILEDLNVEKSKKFIEKFLNIILDLSFMHQEVINNFVKNFLNEKNDYLFSDFLIEEEVENLLEKKNNIISQFIKIGILFSYLTYNLKQTNQLISNFILLTITLVSKISYENEENKFLIVNLNIIFLSILSIITENINCYNPDILNLFKNVLNSFENSEFLKTEKILKINSEILKNDLITGSNLDLFEFKNFIDTKKEEKNYSFFIFFRKIILLNLDLMRVNRDDLNFNILFNENILFIKKIKNKFQEKLTSDTNQKYFQENFFIENYGNLFNQNFDFYNICKEKCLAKKNVQINFLILKTKAIPSLEPEYEFGQVDYTIRKVKIQKAIVSKIKKTKKQVIRNLKKESRVIDQERQKVLKRIDHKRKEDQKFSNQFAEQSNVEYKKLMTMNEKKRFKLKRGKINKK